MCSVVLASMLISDSVVKVKWLSLTSLQHKIPKGIVKDHNALWVDSVELGLVYLNTYLFSTLSSLLLILIFISRV